MNFKKYLPFLLAFVLPLVAVFAWWGGFNSVSITTDVRGPYTYAYLEHTGDYTKLPKLTEEARAALHAQGVSYDLPITILYSNPEVVQMGERQARTGFLVAPGSEVAEPLKIDTIPARPVLMAKVRAGLLLAPSKAYQALDKHLQAQGQGIRMPTVEIYAASDNVMKMGELTVEMALQ